ncbi:prepilin-type N-terminal cleavage/methylation domain-containing protein [Haloferula rosea]|uniref:prepilin-type N-terminal cleavage/methylation domain-containing protein n=1 Tax=Haloferula rosea TaxID=490093 RepID=UPI0019062E31|nr:prepilin-type N-terminal cleavage/methylation domain-containing protein [Haloferula rosea]
MRRVSFRRKRGYTLVELTLAMSVGMMVAAISLMLFNQQMSFLRIFRAQDFLVREAPLISNYMVRVIGSAEGYQLFSDMASLRSGDGAVLEDAKVLVLRFMESDGTERASVLSFEDPGGGLGPGLYYRLIPDSGVVGSPDWAISKEPADVTFAVEQGILRMTLSGPNGEELVYSGTQQL